MASHNRSKKVIAEIQISFECGKEVSLHNRNENSKVKLRIVNIGSTKEKQTYLECEEERKRWLLTIKIDRRDEIKMPSRFELNVFS